MGSLADAPLLWAAKGNVDCAEREDASSAKRVKRYCSKECVGADGPGVVGGVARKCKKGDSGRFG